MRPIGTEASLNGWPSLLRLIPMRTAIRRIRPATAGFSNGSDSACCGASSKSSLRHCTTKAIWICRKHSSMGAPRQPSREALASARLSVARGRRSWPSPIVRGSRSPFTWRAPRPTKSPWCWPHSRFVNQLPVRLIGDNAYESDRLDAELARRGVELIAPHRRTRTQRTQDGRPLRRYQRRWKIERLFAWLQNFRRLVVRYERFAENFLGMLHLASCLILLRSL